MTSPARALAVLGLFTPTQPTWLPDEINERLGYTRATGYRYVKDLVDAGLLQRLPGGRYALGPRIIELDFELRRTDPVLLAAIPPMQRLAASSGFDAVLTVLFAGMKVIDTHRVYADAQLQLGYGRGRPRPLFRSAAPKVLLAGLSRVRLQRLWQMHAAEIAEEGMGATWEDFRQGLSTIRRAGAYRSRGELEAGIGAMAVPVHDGEGEVVAALALVGSVERLDIVDDDRLLGWLRAAALEIRGGLR